MSDLARVTFDAALLKRGRKTFVLTARRFEPVKGSPPKRTIGNSVYDCLRLEAIPTQTGSAK